MHHLSVPDDADEVASTTSSFGNITLPMSDIDDSRPTNNVSNVVKSLDRAGQNEEEKVGHRSGGQQAKEVTPNEVSFTVSCSSVY